MPTNARVVLTNTSISVFSSRDVFMTSIPLRTWIKAEGNRWVRRLLRPHEINFLVKRLSTVLNAEGPLSVTKRISQVMKEPIPAPPEKKTAKSEPSQKKITKSVNDSSSSQLLGETRPPGCRARILERLGNPMLRTSGAMTVRVW